MGGLYDYYGDHSAAARGTDGLERKQQQRSGCHTGYHGETQTTAEKFGMSIVCGKKACDSVYMIGQIYPIVHRD